MDKTFTETYKQSSSGLYVARLFRLPDADDGSMRMSIDVRTKGGYVFFLLTGDYWLGENEQIDGDAQQDILFFTCNGQTRAFIYDIANTTLVDGATELHPKDRLAWDPDGKCWLRYGFLYGDSYEKTVLLKLPYPEPSTENYKVIPTSDERFVLVLKRLESSFAIGPTMWELGVVDVVKCTWMVKSFPYMVPESALKVVDGKVECYGYNSSHTSCTLFRFFPDDIIKEKKVILFVHNFEPMRPGQVVWDDSSHFWRAVIRGEIIYPRPFYFDNTYSENYPIDGTRVPAEVLELLPPNEEMLRRMAEEREKQKQQLREEYEKNNTPMDELVHRNSISSLFKKIFGK